MRLHPRPCTTGPAARSATLLLLGLAGPLWAQPLPDDLRLQSVLALERPGYEPRQIKLGSTILSTQLDVGVIYDNNIYAAHSDRTHDALLTVQPALTVRNDQGEIRWQADLSGEFRRYQSTSVENSDSYAAGAAIAVPLFRGTSATAKLGYRRAVENRSDPEVRQDPLGGPPLIDIASGEAMLKGGRGKLGFSVKGLIEKYDFVSRVDDDRDFTSRRATARILYQLSAVAHGFVQGFMNMRNFRLRDARTGASRDGRTVGGLIGAEFDPGGKLRGDVGVGLFRYKADSSTFASFSGFALEGHLVYTPRARTAVLLDLFRGDVATVRNGASGRIDTRARLGVQQEIRHNLLGQVAVRYRESKYRGSAETLKTLGGDVELEYLANRHVSVALVGRLVKRTGGQIRDRFERARIGIELRGRY